MTTSPVHRLCGEFNKIIQLLQLCYPKTAHQSRKAHSCAKIEESEKIITLLVEQQREQIMKKIEDNTPKAIEKINKEIEKIRNGISSTISFLDPPKIFDELVIDVAHLAPGPRGLHVSSISVAAAKLSPSLISGALKKLTSLNLGA